MKKIYIIHGWEGSPDEPMHQWLKFNLEKDGHEVIVPAMPEPNVPKIETWVGKLKEVVKPDSETVLVGHSIGCQTVLRYVETLPENLKIAGIVLIAPWIDLDEKVIKQESEEDLKIRKPWAETPINFEKIKKHIKKVIAIFSDNDEFVSLSQKDLFEKYLNAEIIVEHNKFHFDPGSGIKELPSALEAVKNLLL